MEIDVGKVKPGDKIEIQMGGMPPEGRPVLWYRIGDGDPIPVAMADDGTWTVPGVSTVVYPPATAKDTTTRHSVAKEAKLPAIPGR